MIILNGEFNSKKTQDPDVSALRKNFNFLIILMNRILDREDSLPGFSLHTEKYGYILALIQKSHPALGP